MSLQSNNPGAIAIQQSLGQMLQPVGQTLDQLRTASENRFGDGWTTAGFTAAQAALEVGGFLGGVAAIPGGRAALYGLGDSIQGGLNTLVDAMPVGSGDAARRGAASQVGAVGDLERLRDTHKTNDVSRSYGSNELERHFVGPQRPISRQRLDMLTAHPDAHSIERHGGSVTDPQLMYRSLTGIAPDGHVKIDGKSGKVILPPMSSAFHSDQLLAYADDAIRNNGTLATKITQNPGAQYVTLTPEDVGDLGYNLGRGYARIGGSKLDPTLQGAPKLIENLRSVQATYGFNPLTNRWEPVTIFPAR
jgi:hypothetical protein